MQVQQLLLDDPENTEYQDIYNSLQEVIDLTQDLLREARKAEVGTAQQAAAARQASAAGASSSVSGAGQQAGAPPIKLSLLPASVADQIRKAQAKAALTGQAPAAWAVGAECEAIYSADGMLYPAVVESVTAEGNFVVEFVGYGNKEEVRRSCSAATAASLLNLPSPPSNPAPNGWL